MNYQIVKARHWPFAPYDVVVSRLHFVTRDTADEYHERQAGGFFTRRGAQHWIDRERGQI